MSGTLQTFQALCAGILASCCSLNVGAQDILPRHEIAIEKTPAPRVVRITLPEAQSRAGETPAVRAANLTADAAMYRRQAAAADYYPKVSSTFANMHFNKLMGDRIAIANRSVEVPLLNKDQSILALTVAQPITPLLKVREAVKLAKADEIIADAKATKAIADVASNVEESYFALLISQLQRDSAAARIEALQPQVQIAGSAGPAALAAAVEREVALREAGKEFAEARKRVLELTQSLNALIGLPPFTELELTMPDSLVEEPMTLATAKQRGLAANVEVVEAEQGLAKAQAAAKLAKLEYVPDVAVLGGYSYQTAMNLLPADFTFLGVVATFNVFDFGKREKTIKERKTYVELAQIHLQEVKAKVATAVQRAYLDLEHASQIRSLRRELLLARRSNNAVAKGISVNRSATESQSEVELAQAELNYRLAYLQLKHVIGDR